MGSNENVLSVFIFSATCCNVPPLECGKTVKPASAALQRKGKSVMESAVCGLMQTLLGPQMPSDTAGQL